MITKEEIESCGWIKNKNNPTYSKDNGWRELRFVLNLIQIFVHGQGVVFYGEINSLEDLKIVMRLTKTDKN